MKVSYFTSKHSVELNLIFYCRADLNEASSWCGGWGLRAGLVHIAAHHHQDAAGVHPADGIRSHLQLRVPLLSHLRLAVDQGQVPRLEIADFLHFPRTV